MKRGLFKNETSETCQALKGRKRVRQGEALSQEDKTKKIKQRR